MVVVTVIVVTVIVVIVVMVVTVIVVMVVTKLQHRIEPVSRPASEKRHCEQSDDADKARPLPPIVVAERG